MKIQFIERFMIGDESPMEVGHRAREIEMSVLPPKGTSLVLDSDGEDLINISDDAEITLFLCENRALYDFEADEDLFLEIYHSGDTYNFKEGAQNYAKTHPEWEWEIW